MSHHVTQLQILRDLMLGGRHSRRTVARAGVSLPTADRWLAELARHVPGVRKAREGRTTWYDWRPPEAPTRYRVRGTVRVRVAT